MATRGSDLALWQAHRAQATLGTDAELVLIESKGDRDRTTELARFGSIGIFTVEVDCAVLDGRADVGVHSLKDMTTTLQDGVELAGVLPRGLVEDCLVARQPDWDLDGLPRGARVGTGSQRRGAMLLRARPDLELVPLRGNVATRIERVTSGALDATVLARAGLVRLGLEAHVTEVLDAQRFLPAVGQGIVGLTCRSGDAATRERIAASARDADAWSRALAERAFLRAMKGGCNAPVGGHARPSDEGRLTLTGCVLSIDGTECVEGEQVGTLDDPEGLGIALAESLTARGGAALVEAARRALEDDRKSSS